jgi:hypothetical protein
MAATTASLPLSRNPVGAPGCTHPRLIRYSICAPYAPKLLYFRDYAECPDCGLHRASNLKRVSRQTGRKYPTTREQALAGPRANVVAR